MFAVIGGWWSWLWNTKWARDMLIGAGMLLVALAGVMKWRDNIQKGVRRQEREARERQDSETRAAVAEKQNTILKEEVTYANEALEARDSNNHYPTADSVPDDIAEVLFRSSRGGEGRGDNPR